MNEQTFTLEELQKAFDVAEQETAEHFNGQTCSMESVDGENECPICDFRIRVKNILRQGVKEHD